MHFRNTADIRECISNSWHGRIMVRAPPPPPRVPASSHALCACVCVCAYVCVGGAVTRLIDANKLPHLLLYGPPGTGKTSTILACARRMYRESLKTMVLEVRPRGRAGG